MSTSEPNATQVVSKFFYQHQFAQSEDAVIVFRLHPMLTLFAANDRARQTVGSGDDWPANAIEDCEDSTFAKRLLAMAAINDATGSSPQQHRSELGWVRWTPFQCDDGHYAVLTIQSASEPMPKPTTESKSMNSMAVAHWLKTFIHQISQPLHVNQNTADIMQIEAEQNKIDSQTVQPRLERLQFAGNLLRECLSDLRKQIQLMSIAFSQVNVHELLSRVVAEFNSRHGTTLNLQLASAEDNIIVHGNAALLSEAFASILELTWDFNQAAHVPAERSAFESLLSVSMSNDDGLIQINIGGGLPSQDSLAFVDHPLMKQGHQQLIPAATWGVCESIIQVHHGELLRPATSEAATIQIGLPAASERTQEPNVNVALHRVWPPESES
ncbi:hypothetical protein [Novipirellula caenicola]|uniref:Uncharacterized protein n=1 Tax=Novipirellula caenicola TaxID=1536901 RepID=A0ABP9VIT6_9BACT